MRSFLARLLSNMFRQEDERGRALQWAPMLGHVLALLITLLIGIGLSRYPGTSSLIGLSLIIVTSALTVGGSLGFLFGVPRINTQLEAAVNAAVSDVSSLSGQSNSNITRQTQQNSSQKSRSRRLLSTNTNLEKVSDWLTTMLVGVGLTQLGNINSALVGFRDFLSQYAIINADMNSPTRAGLLPAIGPMLLIAGTSLGFIYFYVFTRVVIAPKFDEVESTLEIGPVVSERSAVNVLKEVADDLQINTPATRNVIASSTPRVDDSLAVMYEALYQRDGYRNVIRLGDALSRTDARRHPEYWFYLAAARGQEHKAVEPPEDKKLARDAVMEAARRAVELNASYRSRLWLISSPDGVDDDLSDFRDDPEFLQIVGKSIKGSIERN